MKEVLFKREYSRYENYKYKDYNPIDFNNSHESNSLLRAPTKENPLFRHDITDLSEETFSENFINPMWSLTKYNYMVVVEKYGDKVSIKTFKGFKHRRCGKKWFKVSKSMDFITVNTKTGDVYVGCVNNYNLKRKCKKSFRRNYFIGQPLSTMMSNIKNNFRGNNDNTLTHTEAISIFMNQVDGLKDCDNLNVSERLFKYYLNKRGIKVPNNFYVFNDFWFGPEIRIATKKSNNKMVDGLMLSYGLTGNQIKRALHNCEYFNVYLLKSAIKLFGYDWISQDYNVILECLNSRDNITPPIDEFYDYVTKEELKRIFNIFKQVIVYKTLNSHTFNDHIKMYTDLKRYGEVDLKWMSSSNGKIGFMEEHLDWVNKLEFYRNGVYTRVYPKYSYNLIQNAINVGQDTYYPVLLNNSEDYNQESHIQSNCVKTYIGKPSSIIISLRKNDINSEERATIEYQIQKEFKNIQIKRVQSLGRFNNKLSEEWDDILFSLDEVMVYYVNNENFDTVKIIKECKNGVKFNSNSSWGEDGKLIWEEKRVNGDNNKLEMNFF